MANATTRDEFKEVILRRLGKPVIQINVDDDQVEDRIDYTLQRFIDHHYDGTEKIYFKKQVTAADKTNGYLTLPDNVVGVVNIFDFNTTLLGGGGLFSANYQFVLNNIWTWQVGSLVPYYMAMQHLQLIEQVLNGQVPLRYNRRKNRVYLDMNWDTVVVGTYIIVEAYAVVDGEDWEKVWADTWLVDYATAQVKQVWGNNLKKYKGVQLPGNVQFSGQEIYDEATAEIKELDQRLMDDFGSPLLFIVG
jgi:hypothetical protein